MFYFITMFIPFLLHIILMFQVKRRFFKDKEYTKKFKIPIYAYLIFFAIALIPVISWIAFGFWIWLLVKLLEDGYYKPGWFIKLLQKEV